MRVVFTVAATSLTGLALADQLGSGEARDLFNSDDYTVTWGSARDFDASAALEIGAGAGHGLNLEWMRFQPGKDGVDVLSIRLEQRRQPYRSKWPPDRAPVAVKHARMTRDAYAALLRELAVVDAAKLAPAERSSVSVSSRDFWVCARLTSNEKTLVELDWAGYWSSRVEVDLAKPRAAVALAGQAVEGLDFKEHALSAEERAWASEKFARDWKRFKDLKSHWWVRERYLITIGVVGDETALPTLRDILGGDPKDRCVYYAINAVTRLTNKDVRAQPAEEMDVERTRRRVLEVLRSGQ